MIGLLLAGCIKNNNPTGNNWSNVRPLSFIDTLACVAGYSYAGSGTITGTETKLLCGDYDGIESVAFMRFTGLPTPGDFHIPAAYQDSTYLTLTLTKRSPALRYPVELKIYKLNQSWAADSTAYIQDANLSLITPQAFTIPDTVLATGTEVKIPIPISALENWTSEEDSLGITLAVKTGDYSYVEMDSEDSGRGPQLRFLYRDDTEGGSTDDVEYDQACVLDSYRVDSDEASLLTDRWIINNITPSRVYVNFPLDYTLFKGMDGTILNEQLRKRVTINSAELIFYVKENPYYRSSTQYSLRGDRVDDSLDVTVAVDIEDSQTTSGITSQALVRGDSVVVNVTPIIQAFSNGKKQNFGIVIRSMEEMLNYGWLEFWHFTDAPANKQPKIRITYTPPYL
jgi:hypothetical protein